VSEIPECPARHLASAFAYANLGSTQDSLREWKLFAGSVHPILPTSKFERSQALFARHDFSNAASELESLIPSLPNHLSYQYLLARTYEALSVEVLVKMLSIDPEFYRAHELLAKAYETRNEDQKALAEFQTVEHMRPALPGLHYEMGHLLWAMQDSESASEQLRKELQLNPAHPEANAELGTILVSEHEFREAVPYLQRALALKPDLPAAREQLGLAFYQLNELSSAERELKRALPGDTQGNAHYLLGMVYRKLGRPQESNAALAESRRIRAERLAGANLEKDEATP